MGIQPATNPDAYDYHQGFFNIVGEKTATLPTNITATYLGAVTGFVVDKKADNYSRIDGKGSLTASFTAATISGKFDQFTKVNNITIPDVIVSNGVISGNGFSGDVAISDTSQAPLTGKIKGNFYGNGAAEIGATASLDNDAYASSLAFTGKK